MSRVNFHTAAVETLCLPHSLSTPTLGICEKQVLHNDQGVSAARAVLSCQHWNRLRRPTETMKMVDIKRVFDTNFFSQLNLIQTVLPHMRSKKMGLIINITSIAGYLGLPFWSAYCASKASFRVIAESLNIELKKYNVNVVNIAPGDYKTEILNNRRDSDNPSSSPYFQEYEKIIKSVNGKMNHGRDPIEVANLVLKIIKEKKPKINYLVGGFLEKKITLKSLLPDKLFQKIIIKLYS